MGDASLLGRRRQEASGTPSEPIGRSLVHRTGGSLVPLAGTPVGRDRPGVIGSDALARRSLRIAVVAPPFFPIPPVGYGGIERVVASLTDGLVASGHDVTLFAAAGSSTRAHLVTPLSHTPTLGNPSSVVGELHHTTAALLRAGDFDVVHDHTAVGPALGALLAGKPPVVHTLHGPWTTSSTQLFDLVRDRVHLVAISHAQRRANPTLGYAGVVYNGIDLAAHPYRAVKEDFVVFLGRVSPEKRPEVAIEVARRAGVPIVMIVKRSEPAERAYWDQVVAPFLGPDVEVVDQPSHGVKVDLVGRARALLFPIDWPEPFGLVMIEAMACGTPVIARPLGAAPEVIEDGVTGFLSRTTQEMAAAVDGARWVAPKACRERVQRLFSDVAMVEGYERVYQRTLGGLECVGLDGDRSFAVPAPA